jgi:phage shock protein A
MANWCARLRRLFSCDKEKYDREFRAQLLGASHALENKATVFEEKIELLTRQTEPLVLALEALDRRIAVLEENGEDVPVSYDVYYRTLCNQISSADLDIATYGDSHKWAIDRMQYIQTHLRVAAQAKNLHDIEDVSLVIDTLLDGGALVSMAEEHQARVDNLAETADSLQQLTDELESTVSLPGTQRTHTARASASEATQRRLARLRAARATAGRTASATRPVVVPTRAARVQVA